MPKAEAVSLSQILWCEGWIGQTARNAEPARESGVTAKRTTNRAGVTNSDSGVGNSRSSEADNSRSSEADSTAGNNRSSRADNISASNTRNTVGNNIEDRNNMAEDRSTKRA